MNDHTQEIPLQESPSPLVRRGDRLILRIEKTAYEGKTIAHADGFVIFVEVAVPGDTVETEVFEKKKNHAGASYERVVEASPHRVELPCRHFGPCCGCSWQHLSYDEQLRWKREHVATRSSASEGFTACRCAISSRLMSSTSTATR